MSCAPALKDFGRQVRAFLRTDAAYAILGDDGDTWTAGGCWLLAAALGPLIDAPLAAVWSREPGRAPQLQHVILHVGEDCYLDADGAQTRRTLLRRMVKYERLTAPYVGAFDARVAHAGRILCAPARVLALREALWPLVRATAPLGASSPDLAAAPAPTWLRARRGTRVQPHAFGDLIAHAVKFPEFVTPTAYTWTLIRGVPIDDLDPPTRADYEEDPEDDDDDTGNLDRYERLEHLLIDRGAPRWPVVVEKLGRVIDGYHRLAVLADNGVETVDVLWVQPRARR